MSGIAGILRRDGRPIPENWVNWLQESIAQRGSDSAGKFRDTVDTSAGKLEIVLLNQQMGVCGISQPIVIERNDDIVAALAIDGPSDCVSNSQFPIIFPKDVPFAAAFWDAQSLQLHLVRGGSGQKPLYMLDLGEAGDGIIFCSIPTPLNSIARELALDLEISVAAMQQYLQLGFVTEENSLISPVKAVPRSDEINWFTSDQHSSIDHAIEGSPSPASDLQDLVSQLGQPFADATLMSRLWTYKAQKNQMKTIKHGLQSDTIRMQRAKSLASWHSVQSLFPGQSAARDWVKFGITTVDSNLTFDMIEEITGYEFETPYVPKFNGTIYEQLASYDAACRVPDCVLRGIDAAAMLAGVDVHVEDGSEPYSFKPIPLETWFRSDQGDLGQLAGDVFTSENVFDNAPIDRLVVQKMFEDHRSGRISQARPLFALLTLGLWLRL